ncbi:MAG: hypothetical protein Q4D41_04200 [Prevotellaceae bacterium]|nr:hypothetical protein [Prevotellaceae bacterium]
MKKFNDFPTPEELWGTEEEEREIKEAQQKRENLELAWRILGESEDTRVQLAALTVKRLTDEIITELKEDKKDLNGRLSDIIDDYRELRRQKDEAVALFKAYKEAWGKTEEE